MISRQEIESLRRSKRKMRLSIILGSAFILLLVAIIILSSYFGSLVADEEEKIPPVALEGEDVRYGNLIAYPVVDANTINRITVNNQANKKDGEFTFVKDSLSGGDFLFTYKEDGEVKVFYPSILGATGVKYSDLYSIESTDGYNQITKIKYLTAALESAYFGQRIPLSTEEGERAQQLSRYGFVEGEQTIIVFDYTDPATAKTGSHKITIGAKTITGSGYYFMVDGRDYVYNSVSNYFDYAMAGFYSFVSTTVITPGLSGDSVYGPIFTPDFTHLENTIHKDPDENGNIPRVEGGSTVVINASTLAPVRADDYLSNPSLYGDLLDGYEREDSTDMTIDLSVDKDNKIKKSLVGLSLGVRYDESDPTADINSALFYTIGLDYNKAREIDFGAKQSIRYDYVIEAIEAVVTDAQDKTVEGTDVALTDTVRVSYRYRVNGKWGGELPSHAVLDLTSDLLPSGVAEAIADNNVGELASPVEFTINYTKDNADKTEYKTVITEIISVMSLDGEQTSIINENTAYVMYRYALMVDGVVSDEQTVSEVIIPDLDTEPELILKSLLMGQKVGAGLELVLDEGEAYSEVFKHFTTYVVNDIKYYITSREIVSLSYLNYSQRDPFYGESVYENNTEGYELYGVNNDYADHILKLIGGLGSNTSMAVGLSGEELVSVGITPDKLMNYGCYSHTLRFVLPRGLITISSGSDDIPDDYTMSETLPLILHISDIQADGTRYVASELYDTIVKVSNDSLFFLDEGFVDFWARKNLIMTNVNNLFEVNVEISLEEFSGAYNMVVVHDTAYKLGNGMLQIGGEPPKDYLDAFDTITVNVTPGEGGTETKLKELISSLDRHTISLDALYEYTVADEEKLDEYLPDSLGSTYFKEFMLGLFYINQEGAVNEDKQNEVLSGGKMLMKFSMKIDTDKDGERDDEGYYVFEFYQFPEEEKLLVSLYRTDKAGNVKTESVSDFYISRFAFKRAVSSFISLVNGEEFELGMIYPELK